MPRVTEVENVGWINKMKGLEGDLGTRKKEPTPERKASGLTLGRVTGAIRRWVMMTRAATRSYIKGSAIVETKYGL